MAIYHIGEMTYSNELYHYGIRGQKWGVRRFQDLSGKLTAAGRERYSSEGGDKQKKTNKEYENARKAEKKEWKARRKEMIRDAATSYKMSDKELIEKIGRLEREQRLMGLTYDRLMSSPNPYANMAIRSGKKVVENFISGAGAYTMNSLIGLIPPIPGASKLSRSFDAKEFSKWAFPNPNQKKK